MIRNLAKGFAAKVKAYTRKNGSLMFLFKVALLIRNTSEALNLERASLKSKLWLI